MIGLGYVGLPLAKIIAKNKKCLVSGQKINRKIIGYDLDKSRIKQLINGIDRNNISGSYGFNKIESLEFTYNLEILKNVDVFIITVPTPITKNKDPDLFFIKEASKTVGNLIKSSNSSKDNQIIIFESTVYPGVTEDICVPIIEQFSKKKFNSNRYKNAFYCGYSPERINPGDPENTIDKIKKITSGSNEEVSIWIDSFYSSFIDAGTFKARNIKIAEAAKIIENTQRDINIALVNELSILFKKLNIDTNEVLEAAATKWNFHKYKPGLVGGHCIGVDPYYLTFKAREIGFKTELIASGRKINDYMHEYLLEQIILQSRKRNVKYQKENVLILGITYKENCPDIRNSQILLLVENMVRKNMNITIVDPIVDPKKVYEKINLKSYESIPESEKYTIIIFALNHLKFDYISNQKIKEISYQETIVFDLTNKLFGENIFHL